jgi:hypothetical protein
MSFCKYEMSFVCDCDLLSAYHQLHFAYFGMVNIVNSIFTVLDMLCHFKFMVLPS